MTESRDVDAVPRFRNDDPRWTDWGWPEQAPNPPTPITPPDPAPEDDPT